jgi:hypothetical protein
MDQRVQEILDNATDIQHEYVIARLTCPNSSRAAKAIGLHRASPYNWDNLEELEEAVRLLRRDAVEAARLALQGLALDAVATLGGVQGGTSTAAINAANSILDRVGLPKQNDVKHSGAGEDGELVVRVIYGADRSGSDDTST